MWHRTPSGQARRRVQTSFHTTRRVKQHTGYGVLKDSDRLQIEYTHKRYNAEKGRGLQARPWPRSFSIVAESALEHAGARARHGPREAAQELATL